MLDVSSLTIRRDLQYLEDEHLIERYYGGARLKGMRIAQEIYDDVSIYRQKIAKYAASLIVDGDIVFINSSSTALGILPYITAKRVTVITNNGNVVNTLYSPNVSIILTGGELRQIKGTMAGEFTLDYIDKVIVKKAFVGCSGLSSSIGMTTDILNEVKINATMLKRGKENAYILADYEKVGRIRNFVSCPTSDIYNIITDERANKEEILAFTQQKKSVIQVRNDMK